jgi:hypothetical protein
MLLIVSLATANWWRLALSPTIYFFYGRHHSGLMQRN